MTSIALTALALTGVLAPCPDGPAMRVLRDAAKASANPFSPFIEFPQATPRVYAVNLLAPAFCEPEPLVDDVREGMQRVRQGMGSDEVERLLGVTRLSSSICYGSSFGFTHIYKVGTSYTLTLRYNADEPGLSYATLSHGDHVIEHVGR